jgi:glycosidase
MFKFALFVLLSILLSIQGLPFESQEDSTSVPQWAKKAIWYQIFPERFRNGDRNNDPTLEDMKGGWPYFQPENWQIHPWTSDWHKLQPWEKQINWHEHFDWAKPGELNFNACAGLRRYGGDLKGVIEKLDYLQELGITAIYFNPLFESPSLHKYDAAMYHHIDNNFGPNPDKDRQLWSQENPADPSTWKWTTADSLFLSLIAQCHQRGIRVIIDGVFNHVGYTFWAFQDVLKNQENTPYKDWFVVKSWDNPQTPENEFRYQGWNGVRDLPEIKENENGLLDGPRDHIKLVIKRWMDPNDDADPSDGIDGWRLDVAEKVNIQFWRDFRIWVKEINPEAYITGEIWWEDWPRNKMFNASPWLQGDVFDAVMNYRWGRAAKQFVINEKNKINSQGFVDSIKAVFKDYPLENVYALQNMVDSHDMERIASQTVNPDSWPDHGGNPSQNPDFDVRKPNDEERLKQKLVVAMQMTMPGAPLVYYGDEAGMWGGDDPDCRKPMVWPEFEYEVEISHPLNIKRPDDKVFFDTELFDWYKKMIDLRKKFPEFSTGGVEFFLIDNEKGVLGYNRYSENQRLFVVINSTGNSVSTSINIKQTHNGSITDLISGKDLIGENGQFQIFLEPYQIIVLK